MSQDLKKKTEGDPNDFDMNDIQPEQVLAGILTVLAYDKHNEHLEYYRSIIMQAKPNIKSEPLKPSLSNPNFTPMPNDPPKRFL